MNGEPVQDGTHSSREKILIAAATMLGEDPAARLSVRAVAARAGVSAGSLRHFFPTQQALVETVVAGIFDVATTDDPISDTALAPADRLVACMQQVLARVGTGERARSLWRSTFQAYIESPPSESASATYLALEREGRRRIHGWVTALVDEGSVPAGDDERRARFLTTVLDGLSIERALPADSHRATFEGEILRAAVHSVINDETSPS